MASVIRVIAVLALVGAALTACGKRGALEPPESSDETPAAQSSTGDGATKKAKSEESRPFILDPLLR
jgi:predicted small lipoprotein YifL